MQVSTLTINSLIRKRSFFFISKVSVQLGLSSCICALKCFAPKFNTEVVHFWRALIGRIYKRSILFHLTQLKHDSSVNWFDALFHTQFPVMTASTISVFGFPKNKTASKFLTHNSDFLIYTTVTITVSCDMKHDARKSITRVHWLLFYKYRLMSRALTVMQFIRI